MAIETTYLTVMISLIALIISFSSLIYSYLQNRRKINVNLFIENDEDDEPVVHLMAFNSGYRSIALIRSKFLVNEDPIDIKEGMNAVDRAKFGQQAPSKINYWFTEKFDFTETLKEGGTAYYSLRANVMSSILHYKEYSGEVKLGGYFETAENKKIKSKSTINFNIEKYFRE